MKKALCLIAVMVCLFFASVSFAATAVDSTAINWEFVMIVAGLIVAAFVYFYFFILVKCPKCGRRGKSRKLGEKEIDRWKGSKEVEDKDSSGNVIAKRTISVDYAKIEIYRECKECSHKFSIFKKREL